MHPTPNTHTEKDTRPLCHLQIHNLNLIVRNHQKDPTWGMFESEMSLQAHVLNVYSSASSSLEEPIEFLAGDAQLVEVDH